MLERNLSLKVAIISDLEESDHSHLLLLPEDWKITKEIVNLLKPFKEVNV